MSQSMAVAEKRRPMPWFVPSLADFLFVVLLVVMFAASGGGWQQLLNDGDTGWHIRTGEWILRTHAVPRTDLFSFSKPGAPWFAWEWLADVIFAAAYGQQGLKGVVVLSALLIGGSLLILFRYMLWRGAGMALATIFCLLVADASQVHYLARPHLFTLLLLPICIWLLDRDREQPTAAVWLLAPLAALWANLHGGFLALIAWLGLWTAGTLLRDWSAGERRQALAGLRRNALLTGACLAATLANPYGYRLYTHVVPYLRSDWIAKNVDEFQPPQIRSEGMYKFEGMLFLGVGLLAVLVRRRRYAEALQVGFWAHAALQSVRHVPVYMIAAAPVAATELALLAEGYAARRSRSSWIGALRQMNEEYTGKARRNSVWLAAVAALLWFTPAGQRWPQDFPARFPGAMVSRNQALLSPAGQPAPRLLSSDEWGGYLIFRLYPAGRVFMDGRSDFYGPEVGNDYICLMHGCPRWEQLLEKWHFQAALLPPEWPLVQLLGARPEWRIVDRDRTAVLFQKLR